MTRQRGRTSLAVLLVAVAATGFWSCSGPAEGPTSPVGLHDAAASLPGDDGGVTASAKGKITICHKGESKQVPPSALGGHLGHGDRLGTCTPAPDVACPCFTASGLADVAAQCSASLTASCPQTYSLSMFCSTGTGGTVNNLGLFEARLGTGTCSTTSQDFMTGEAVTDTKPVTEAQFEACRQAIVGTAVYPASCPR
jgi:hypothetical protein